MDGQANRFGLIGQSPLDRLFNPPGTVGRELSTFRWVESLDRLHQADISFIDEIQQRKAQAFVIVRDLYDQAKVRLDHLFARFFVTLLNLCRKFHLFLRGQ